MNQSYKYTLRELSCSKIYKMTDGDVVLSMCSGRMLDLSKDTSHIQEVRINIRLSKKMVDTIIRGKYNKFDETIEELGDIWEKIR